MQKQEGSAKAEKKNGQEALSVLSRHIDTICKFLRCYYYLKVTLPGALEVIQHIINHSNIV